MKIQPKWRHWKIRTRAGVATLVGFLVVGSLSIFLVHKQILRQAVREAEIKSQLMLDRNLAIHSYFTHQLKPRLLPITDASQPREYFDPVWMSSTYAVREIQKYFSQLGNDTYYYRECAVNARSPENEADEIERDFIRRTGLDPALRYESLMRRIDGKPYLQVLRRGEVMEEACLRCHTTPDRAPEGLVKEYGAERSFHRSLGEVVSAISIRIPLAAAFAQARDAAVRLSLLLVGLLSVLSVIQFWSVERLIATPLARLRDQARRISSGKDEPGGRIPRPAGRELIELTDAFNHMSSRLRQHHDELEGIIRERTARLLAGEEFQRAVVECSPVALISTDPGGNVLTWNASAEQIFGWSAQEVAGRPLPIVPEGKEEAFGELCKRLLAGRTFSRMEVKARKKPGELLDAAFSASPIRDAGGSVIGMMYAVEDITDRKRAEKDKTALETQLRQTAKMEAVGRLAGGIAHNFNNILGIVLGFADLAVLSLENDKTEARAHIAKIKDAAARASLLVRQLVTFSKKQAPQPQVVDVNLAVSEMEKLLRGIIGEDIELISILDPQLFRVSTNPGSIDQILMDLALNARDAMPVGGRLTIETRNVFLNGTDSHGPLLARPGPYVMIRVTDTGTGVKESIRDRVFEPFFTTKEVGDGVGLGLSCVYGIVEQSGGYVRMDSEEGRGTTFEVFLPAVAQEPEGKTRESLPVLPSVQGSETILVVEDDERLRGTVCQVLEKAGYRVLQAENGTAAIEIVTEYPGPIHLLLTDVVMPGIGGPELASRLRGLKSETKVLYMSGYTDHPSGNREASGSPAAFLPKPFNSSQLTQRVREELEKDSS
ncbi:MAG TPA: DUF3365 domain-containing protein [Syntrophobacteraceae bacterium]|nr:DUF3365 domain-containing protein [Syntrophobacteraceae bacterium]